MATKKRSRRTSITREANPANKDMQFLSDLKSNGWRLTEFAKSLLLGARRKRADLTVAVETGSEEKVDLKASFVQLGAASESLRTKIRDLVGCVTITKGAGSEIRSLGAEPNGDRVADASL